MPKLVDPDKMNCIIPPQQNLGGIYLGNVKGAVDLDLLKENHIRAVLTTSAETAIKYKDSDILFH